MKNHDSNIHCLPKYCPSGKIAAKIYASTVTDGYFYFETNFNPVSYSLCVKFIFFTDINCPSVQFLIKSDSTNQ